MKLTTAGYLRPNGKNIHRYEGAAETDEWGVSPDEGCELRFTDEETTTYLKWRRDRDVVGEAPAEAEPFVDRQLELALEKLRAKLDGPPAS
jgi:carboxyl-terminal processing protease